MINFLKNIPWKQIFEAIKEPLRWFILSVVSFMITTLLENIPGISEFLFEYLGLNAGIAITVLTYTLRAIDKYVYNLQKDRADETAYHGLTGF